MKIKIKKQDSFQYLPRLSFDDMIKKWNRILGWDLQYAKLVVKEK